MDVKLYYGDNLDIFPLLEDESVDTVITDPPYGLEFMGKEWDHGVPGASYWAECLRVAKPGAMLCAFGGTRTHHRLMCAIEDAGWEIRDVLMWVYGSGFPKSHNLSKAIDKAAGAEREVVGEYAWPDGNERNTEAHKTKRNGVYSDIKTDGSPNDRSITAPATDAAALWDGWGTALKPAYEPIILAMKPLPSTFASNALTYGVAGLWVDGCRVGVADDEPNRINTASRGGTSRSIGGNGAYGGGTIGRGPTLQHPQGRWPANLLLSHAPGCECVGVRKVRSSWSGKGESACGESLFGSGKDHDPRKHCGPDGTETVEAWNCVPECPVALLDQSSGESRATQTQQSDGRYRAERYADVETGYWGKRSPDNSYADKGGASRFFTRFHYSAKASRSERELGLLGHIPCLKCGLLDSVTHMNTKTGKEEKCRRNGHPTVKPLDVCRWLCRLTKTPTGGVVLDPFMGSGRIPMAAILEGRDTIGIELERPSFEIAQAAVQWAQEQVPEMVQAEMVV